MANRTSTHVSGTGAFPFFLCSFIIFNFLFGFPDRSFFPFLKDLELIYSRLYFAGPGSFVGAAGTEEEGTTNAAEEELVTERNDQ